MSYPPFFYSLYLKSPDRIKNVIYFVYSFVRDIITFIPRLIDSFRCHRAYEKPPANQKFEPLVSVLLTSYNRPQMVQEAIESVLNQTYQNFELIILDDNSNDETQRVINRYLKDPRVRFYKSDVRDEDRLKETRYAVLINIGLKLAKGDLIAHLCDDDYFLPQKLEKAVRFLQEHPKVKACYNRQKVIPENRIRKIDRIFTDPKKAAGMVDLITIMYYKSCVDEVGNFETGIEWLTCADISFFNKLIPKYPLYPIKEVLDVRRHHPDSIIAKRLRGEI